MIRSYRDALSEGVSLLTEHGVPDAEVDAHLLMEFVCGKKYDRNGLFLHGDEAMPQVRYTEYLAQIRRRCARIPLQHITGTQEFMGLPFFVDTNVLIPRQDTEILVETALKVLRAGDRLLDLCTGSGCVLISLLKYGLPVTGYGADLSEDALSVARRNADENGVSATWVLSDLFDAFSFKFDLITANPPYIPTNIIPNLMPEVRDYDPRNALDGGADGLDFYRRITAGAPQYLYQNGHLFFEVGVGQAAAVSKLLEENGFTEIRITKDYSGNDRVVGGKLNRCLTN